MESSQDSMLGLGDPFKDFINIECYTESSKNVRSREPVPEGERSYTRLLWTNILITYNNNKIMSNQIIRRKELINGNRREKTEDEW